MINRMLQRSLLGVILACALSLRAAEPPAWAALRQALLLENSVARLTVDLQGGSIGDFRLGSKPINPLAWGTPKANDSSIHGFGHFLCLDRWGPPSDSEGARGMPYHGEAANVP